MAEVETNIKMAVPERVPEPIAELKHDDNKRPNEEPADPSNAPATKRRRGKRGPRQKRYKKKDIDPTSPLGVLGYEIQELLSQHGLTEQDITNDMKTILNNEEILRQYNDRIVHDVEILSLSSNGDSLAIIPHVEPGKKQIALIPFGLPGDVTTIKVHKTHPLYVEADLREVSETKTSALRRDEIIKCRYFGKCSGCQFQNVDYEQQLNIKKQTIENAYKFFAPELLSLGKLPDVSETQRSPMEFNYRTKLTPHFVLPNKKTGKDLARPPNLGISAKGRPTWRKNVDSGPDGVNVDIEECDIATLTINQGLNNERKRFHKEFEKYSKIATFLLREDTKVMKEDTVIGEASRDENGEVSTLEVTLEDDTKLVKTCVTNPRQIVQEYIDGYVFEFTSGEFFQNNNSILPIIINYVKSNLKLSDTEPNYLVDAYCGSGLFSITCSSKVSKVIGVEISADSIKFAKINAAKNNISNAKFIVGKAEEIFANIDTPNSQTSVILDPPRKGCDEVFLNQLSDYNPAKIVYISCNVHSQARDVEWFINNTKNGGKYKVESIKGFDFFPQTHHVESVAVLSLKE
ncbi:tRNA (uracil(54)-C(5))-methyltransferase [Candida viswanathii]|uniref:tRNA (uracil(54)-C(5))-methyltransferase n=1 Tax=Candida viswanathii TaxID=5486 RepID=A0A367XRR1_9ASCO|nr:tRNA (uracil(54)-C(5))-methyltransferase [Candida viswanathii]